MTKKEVRYEQLLEKRCQRMEERINELEFENKAFQEMIMRLSGFSQCTCCTKSPELKFHEETCRYRRVMEVIKDD